MSEAKFPSRGIEPRSPAWQAGILATILWRTIIFCVGSGWNFAIWKYATIRSSFYLKKKDLLTQKIILHSSPLSFSQKNKIRFSLMFVVPERMKAIAFHSNRRSNKAIFPTETDWHLFANANQSILAGRAMEFTNEWVSPPNNLCDHRIIIPLSIIDSIYLDSMGFNHWIRIEFDSRKKWTSCPFFNDPFDGILGFSGVFRRRFIGSIYTIHRNRWISFHFSSVFRKRFPAIFGKIAIKTRDVDAITCQNINTRSECACTIRLREIITFFFDSERAHKNIW